MVSEATGIGIGVGLVAAVYLLFEWKRTRSWLRPLVQDHFTPWVEVGTVSNIVLYPVKSFKGHEVSRAECTEYGLKAGKLRDRHFLITDEKTGKFLRAGQYPKMLTMDCQITDDDQLVLKFPDNDHEFRVHLKQVLENGVIHGTRMYDNRWNTGFDCGSEVGQWLQKALGVEDELKLIYFVQDKCQPTVSEPQPNWLSAKMPARRDLSAYADISPYMFATEESLVELNSRLDDPVGMDHFRPNVVVKGCNRPFDEDYWTRVKIGDVEFTSVKACGRCVKITIDPASGKMNPSVEPLKTLRSYRLVPDALKELRALHKDAPIFGVHLGIDRVGLVEIGEKVFVKYKTVPF